MYTRLCSSVILQADYASMRYYYTTPHCYKTGRTTLAAAIYWARNLFDVTLYEQQACEDNLGRGEDN